MLDLNAVLKQIDSLFDENKGKEAEELMKESIASAIKEEDDNALLTLLNELIGYYRESSRAEESFRLAERAKGLMERMGLNGTIPYATTLLNIANAYRAGGRLEDSMECYRETEEIYGRLLSSGDMLMAGLHNNLSLLYQEMGDFAQAKERLLCALGIVLKQENAYFELAVTYANLAATCLRLNEDEEAAGYFKKAIAIFEAHGIQEAHYSAALASLGTYLYKKGEFMEAARHFRRACECVYNALGENEQYRRLKEYLAACEEKAAEKDGMTEGISSGLDLCRAYYEAFGKTMLQEKFAGYEAQIAVGLAGEGSDCFGYDDEASRDHDWGPDFCLWVTQEVYEQIGEALQEAYERLPKEFMGYTKKASPQGRNRRGVQTINGFYGRLLGAGDWEKEDLSLDWRAVSDSALAAAVNGEVFRDDAGIFSRVRERLLQGYPEEIRYLKLAESGARFAQAGQYNYARMARRKDIVAQRILLGDCMREAMKLCYYMENKYPPHDKWLFRGLDGLQGFEEIKEALSVLGRKSAEDSLPTLIEEVAALLVGKLYEKNDISDTENYLDAHTEELLRKSSLSRKSNEELVEEIAELEFKTFDKVRNVGGRADCQNDWYTFSIMRKSQYLTWNRTMLLQYLFDFQREADRGHNLITEKYGRMMESTAPEEYEKIKEHFPVLSEEKKAIVEAVVHLQVGWMEEFEAHYPTLAGNARSVHTSEDNLYNTSYETYLRGEISTYSDKMLELYGRYVVEYAKEGRNLTYDIMTNSVKMYGYKDLAEAEEQMSRLQV